MKQNQSILVIGAGLSGLTAAKQLLQSGHTVQLIEKSKNIGGRLNSKSKDGFQFDQGAQYFQAQSQLFQQQVQKWIQNNTLSEWKMKIKNLKDNQTNNHMNYSGIPQMQQLMNNYEDLRSFIQFNKKVENTSRQNKWIINNKQEKKFDWLIFAIPYKQASQIYPSLFDHVQKDVMIPQFTVILGLEKSLNQDVDVILMNSKIQKMVCDSNKPMRSSNYETWVIHMSAQWTQQNVNMDKDKVLQICIDEIKLQLNTDIQPVKTFVHRWLYSQSDEGAQNLNESGFIVDNVNQIGFCGDWILNKYDGIENAYLSGYNIAEYINNQPKL